ncbi:MAG: hypothetical protein N4A47_02005 [Clostridia bacterium]|jgi:hypothetical protein|nr:hypothetical protein [Clostridia bacterium]
MDYEYYYKKDNFFVERVLEDDADVETTEGILHYKKGYHLIVDIEGHLYACSSDYFEKNYDEYKIGDMLVCKPKYKVIRAKKLEEYTEIEGENGILRGEKGDYLISYNSRSHAICKENVFEETYNILEYSENFKKSIDF